MSIEQGTSVLAHPGTAKAFKGIVRSVDERHGYVFVTSPDYRRGVWVSAEKVQAVGRSG